MQASWSQLISLFAALLACWLVVGIIQRLLLSNIAHIPGPKLAALTSWYEFYYDVVKPGQYVWKIKELHVKYGTKPTLYRLTMLSSKALSYECHPGKSM